MGVPMGGQADWPDPRKGKRVVTWWPVVIDTSSKRLENIAVSFGRAVPVLDYTLVERKSLTAKERLRRLLEVMRQHSTSIEIVMMERGGSCKNRRKNGRILLM